MDVVDYISAERLETYEKHTDRREKAIALHNHTLQLGSSLMSMIALLELSLRNSTNQQLIDDFRDPNWLLPDSSAVPLKKFEISARAKAINHARQGAYSKLSHREKNYLDAFAFPRGLPANMGHKKVVKKRQELFVVSHGQVISQTTFHFWKRLFSNEYEATLWKPSLKKVFPNKGLKRSDISQKLEIVYVTRNRVAHHEPVYGERLTEIIEALEFLRTHLGAQK